MTSSDYTRDGTLILKQPVRQPEILDMLIVGGGPAGIGAAFRAKELGLSALVIDYDDLVKEIRDFAKGKTVLPNYGASDKMKFPRGGELLALLPFEEIDKDDLCRRWKGLFREHSVPAQIGLELVELERQPSGVWKARLYNAKTKAEQFRMARHVVLAMGRGTPQPFNIPGNTGDIAFRLTDPEKYVNGPALVIGGGTSAAEAVIAISNAKADSGDSSAVYWSYRKNVLPKVSKALADEYFDAFRENGNIFTFPKSEPVAVVTAEDHKEYLAIRTDRRFLAERPNETAHLEFPKENCIACTGQAISENFLNKLGLTLVTDGPRQEKRLVVNPLLESQQPNVYLIGSMLGQLYLETADFDADPATFQKRTSGGNIKAALTDGVFVAEVIKQKLEGKTSIQVELKFYETPQAQEEQHLELATVMETMVESSPQEPLPSARWASLVRISANEMEAERYPLRSPGLTAIGRNTACDISFPDDVTMADRHASISSSADGYFLRDDGSHYGIFLRLKPNRWQEISSGDIVQLGKQFLMFRVESGNYYFVHYDLNGKAVNRYILQEETLELGRGENTVLDANDFVLSRRHLAMTRQANKILLQDLASRNGTFLKVRNSTLLETDDEFRVGQQIFKFIVNVEDTRYAVPTVFNTPLPGLKSAKPGGDPQPGQSADQPMKPAPPVDSIKPAPRIEPALPAKEPVKVASPVKPKGEAQAAGEVVVFQNAGKTFPIEKRQTICEVAEKNGIKIKADCHEGTCGSDPIRIISGAENLKPAGGTEAATLDVKYNLTAGEYRLACMAKYTGKGPVVVELLEPKV